MLQSIIISPLVSCDNLFCAQDIPEDKALPQPSDHLGQPGAVLTNWCLQPGYLQSKRRSTNPSQLTPSSRSQKRMRGPGC